MVLNHNEKDIVLFIGQLTRGLTITMTTKIQKYYNIKTTKGTASEFMNIKQIATDGSHNIKEREV